MGTKRPALSVSAWSPGLRPQSFPRNRPHQHQESPTPMSLRHKVSPRPRRVQPNRDGLQESKPEDYAFKHPSALQAGMSALGLELFIPPLAGTSRAHQEPVTPACLASQASTWGNGSECGGFSRQGHHHQLILLARPETQRFTLGNGSPSTHPPSLQPGRQRQFLPHRNK